MKYRILADYGMEGYSFWDKDGFDTVDEAVKEALSCCSKFLIIQVIDWEAKPNLTPAG